MRIIDMKPANDFWHPLNARRAHDLADFCERIITQSKREPGAAKNRPGRDK